MHDEEEHVEECLTAAYNQILNLQAWLTRASMVARLHQSLIWYRLMCGQSAQLAEAMLAEAAAEARSSRHMQVSTPCLHSWRYQIPV